METPPALPQFLPFPDASPPAPLPTSHGALPSYWLETSASPGTDHGVYDGSTEAEGAAWSPEVDVAIIGSGITGISSVYHLVQRLPASVKRVAVFEARDFCSGATGRNGGHLTASSVLQYVDLAADKAYLARFLEAERTEHWGNDRGTKTDETVRRMLTLEARTVAELIMIVRMESMRTTKAGQSSSEDPQLICGSNWHICSSQSEVEAMEYSVEAAKRAGLSDFALQIRRVPLEEWQSRLHQPQDVVAVFEIPGGTVHPRRLVALLWRLAFSRAATANLDLKLWTHTPIVSIDSTSDSDSPTVLHTHKGPVRARYVIHATNAYVSHLLPTQFSGPDNDCRIVPTRGQCIALRPTRCPDLGEPLWNMGFSLNHGYEYLQQRPVDPVYHKPGQAPPAILGGGRQSARGFEWNVADDSSVDADVSSALRPMLSRTFPNNFEDSTQPDLEWTGIMAFTKTLNPWVGPVPDAPSNAESTQGALKGQYVSAGYSGHGMSRAYSCAEVVVDMICAEEMGQQWQAPSWFPLAFLTQVPQLALNRQDTPADSSSIAVAVSPRPRQRSCLTPRRTLLAAGSNGAGQLGLGIGGVEDSPSWAACRCILEGVEGVSPFPPPGWSVIDVRGGANHTIALIERDAGDAGKPRPAGGFPETQVWFAGDASQGQRGLSTGPSTPPKSDDELPAGIFSRLYVPFQRPQPAPASVLRPSEEAVSAGQPTAIATTWNNTFIVVRDGSDRDRDDQIWCLGGEHDFGQLGLPQAVALERSRTKESRPAPHLVDYRRALALGVGKEQVGKEKLWVVAIAAGVRHVIAIVSTTEIAADGHRNEHFFLIGWGAARHGQLQLEETTIRKTVPIEWTPRLICSWTSGRETSAEQRVQLSAGKDHTAVLVPAEWKEDEPFRSSDSSVRTGGLYTFGSNRAGQLDVSRLSKQMIRSGASPHPVSVAATWNSTFVGLTSASQDSGRGAATRPHITQILSSGKNNKGQLGSVGLQQQSSEAAADTDVRVYRLDLPLVCQNESVDGQASSMPGGSNREVLQLRCGSEHVLALVSVGEAGNQQQSERSACNEVWGWGWNEHGNLALGNADDDVLTPVRIWPSSLRASGETRLAGSARDVGRGRVVNMWAGCATSFVLQEETP
ncbi:unnamed protein product [Parajaminaea phylloscopi]